LILAWLAATFIGGLVLGASLTLNSVLTVLLAIAFTLGAFIFRGTRWKLALLLAAAACLGLARSPHAAGAPSPGQLAFYNGKSVSLQGTVSAEPDVRDKGIIYQLSIDSVTYRGRLEKVTGKVELHTPRSQLLEYGDRTSLQGRLVEPKNTAALPYKDILARRGIGSEMSFPRVVDLGPSSTGWMGWIVPLRQHMESGIDQWLPEPEAALLIAITSWRPQRVTWRPYQSLDCNRAYPHHRHLRDQSCHGRRHSACPGSAC
jgi:competence protein ComEC